MDACSPAHDLRRLSADDAARTVLWARGRGESDGRVNWGQAGAFLAVTFGLTVLLNLAVWLTGGLAGPATTSIIGLQMLVPAFSAILLRMFVFRDSPIYIRSYRAKPRCVFSFFLAFTVASAVAAGLVIARPDLSTAANAITMGLSVLGLILVLGRRLMTGRERMA